MNALRYRPLAVFSIVFYVCACFFAGLGAKALTALALTGAAAALILIFFRKTRIAFIGILVLFSISASALFSLLNYALPMGKYTALTGERYVTGTVCREVGGGRYIADAEIDGVKAKIQLESSEFITRGDRFCGKATVALIGSDSKYYKAEGVYLTAKAAELSVEYTESSGIFYTLNNRLSSVFADKLGRSRGGFASSVLLGNRKDLSPQLHSDLKALGLSHLIALSGLHLTVICGIVCILARPFGKKTVLIASMLTSVFYMLFTDMSPSIVRASVMLIFFSLAFFVKRDADVATTVGATALMVTLISPAAAFDLGFQLSLSAVAGVRCASAYLEGDWQTERGEGQKLLFSIISPFAVGFGATVFTLAPLLIYYGAFTWVGALMTVPMSLLLTLIMCMLPPLLILPFDFYSDTVGYLISVFEKWAGGFSDMGEFTLISHHHILGSAAAMAAALGFTLALCTKRKLYRIILVAVSASLVVSITVSCAVNVLTAARTNDVVLEETADGDIITFKSKGVTLALDVTAGSKSCSKKIIDSALAQGDCKADALIIADPHSSHYNALAESGLIYAVDVVYLPECDVSVALAERIDHACTVMLYRPGDSFSFADMKVEVLETLTTERSTRPSVAFAVTQGDEKTVYLGGSYVELGGEIPFCHRLYLGSYGPAYKKSFAVPDLHSIIATSKAEKYLRDPLLP